MEASLSSASDVDLLQVCADEERLGILRHLYEAPATQKDLGAKLRISSGTLSRHMSQLKAAGLVRQGRSSRSPYALTVPVETWQLLRTTTNLNLALTRTKLEALEQRSADLQRAAMRPAPSDAVTESG